VLGTVLTMDSEPYVVIGVLPQGYDFLTPDVDVWVPLQEDPYAWSREQRYTISLARMAPGVTMDQVRLEMDQITEDLRREFPAEYRMWAMSATNLRTDFPDLQSRRYLAVLQGCVFFVLLIACANITNLLARSQDRASEIAVRTALGAGRLRIVLQLMRESAILAGVGGALGLALTAVAIRVVSDRFAGLQWVPSIFEPALDAKVLTFTVSITIFCGLVFGLFPALQAFKVNQVDALKQGGGRGSGLGQRGASVAAGLVVAQIALSLVALGGAASYWPAAFST
jgi:putative ABC transport system permease protein